MKKKENFFNIFHKNVIFFTFQISDVLEMIKNFVGHIDFSI